jgi:hypothetical protein
LAASEESVRQSYEKLVRGQRVSLASIPLIMTIPFSIFSAFGAMGGTHSVCDGGGFDVASMRGVSLVVEYLQSTRCEISRRRTEDARWQRLTTLRRIGVFSFLRLG